MSDPTANPQRREEQVGAWLRTMFADVAAAHLAPPEKARWQKRLIAITNAAKRDLDRADQQLQRFAEEWNAVQRGTEKSTGDSGR